MIIRCRETHFQEELREMTNMILVEDSVPFPLAKTHIRPKVSVFLFSERINSLPQTQSFKVCFFVSTQLTQKVIFSEDVKHYFSVFCDCLVL